MLQLRAMSDSGMMVVLAGSDFFLRNTSEKLTERRSSQQAQNLAPKLFPCVRLAVQAFVKSSQAQYRGTCQGENLDQISGDNSNAYQDRKGHSLRDRRGVKSPTSDRTYRVVSPHRKSFDRQLMPLVKDRPKPYLERYRLFNFFFSYLDIL